ncbi:MAG: STAS domain-containing protein [Legionellaceae bacterium]|nr:STAS domain-containing protein [Legionellaceae bacterium]
MMTHYEVPSTLTFSLVKEIRGHMLAFVRQHTAGETCIFNMKAVTFCDTAGLALLLELQRFALAHSCTLQLQSLTPGVHTLLQFYGIDWLYSPQSEAKPSLNGE